MSEVLVAPACGTVEMADLFACTEGAVVCRDQVVGRIVTTTGTFEVRSPLAGLLVELVESGSSVHAGQPLALVH
jgi:biotin carboxyl carrier protein